VAEGFACYFESPRDAQWSGIGAVNEDRLTGYRKLLKNRHPYCKIDMVVTDRIFRESRTHEERVDAYSVAWSLTHYLMNVTSTAWSNTTKSSPSSPTPQDARRRRTAKDLQLVFTAEQLRTMNIDWHLYMTRLRTDLEDLVPDVGRAGDG